MNLQVKAKKKRNNKLINNKNLLFTKLLMQWNTRQNTREMPWKGEKDPYKIWLSEIILQQTRVEQGLNYYRQFITAFPTIHKLAKAKEERVFKMWEGLGYYTRCKNLISTARHISIEHKGKFPASFEEIKSLKGVGEYTASAIASFAYDLPYAVLDGNVFRVIARVFGVALPTDSAEGKKFFSWFANELLDRNQPGRYNQAIMDFGAVVCKPRLPLCYECMFRRNCAAYQNAAVDKFPVKIRKLKKKIRWLYYYVIECNGKVYIKKRLGKDIWQNLYEFVLLDSDIAISAEELERQAFLKELFNGVPFTTQNITRIYTQQLTHLELRGKFIHIRTSAMLEALNQYELIAVKDLRKFAFPKFILSYLQEKNVNLS